MTTYKITHWMTGAEIVGVEAESLKDAVVKCVAERRPLHGANLQGAYLQGAYLRGADYAGAKIIALTQGWLLDFSWTLVVREAAPTLLRFGCEEHPLADWTPEEIAAMADSHVRGDARYVRMHAALVAFALEFEATMRPEVPVPAAEGTAP